MLEKVCLKNSHNMILIIMFMFIVCYSILSKYVVRNLVVVVILITPYSSNTRLGSEYYDQGNWIKYKNHLGKYVMPFATTTTCHVCFATTDYIY